MNHKTDKKIWDDFRTGENYALSHIYYQHIQSLYRYARKFSNDDDVIKDSIQELFFDLIRNRKKLGPTDNIDFYLMASLRRRLTQSSKQNKVLFTSEIDNNLEAKIVYSAEQEIINKEELTQKEKMLQTGLAELSPKQREILYYKYTCEFSYEQICDIMSLKYDSARKLVFRSLKSLRKSLGDKGSVILFIGLLRGKNKI